MKLILQNKEETFQEILDKMLKESVQLEKEKQEAKKEEKVIDKEVIAKLSQLESLYAKTSNQEVKKNIKEIIARYEKIRNLK